MQKIVLSFATVLAMLAVAATPASADAISGTNKPTPLSGKTNGALANTDLIRINANCQTYRDAGPSLALLLASARNRGVALGTNECYRPLVDQVSVASSWTAAGNSACAAPVSKSPTGAVVGTSTHGWGEAVDFNLYGSFGSTAYRYLKANAAAYGWNHPGWAEPGGSACPEAWHWEWVGNGGTNGSAPIKADVIGLLPSGDNGGYATVTGLGAIARHGNAADHGSAAALPLNWVMVGASSTPSHNGYWMVGADGGVFSYGDAAFYGSTGSMRLNQPVVAMAPTPSGHGYWLVASDGGVFSFGDAGFYGSMGGQHLNKPVVAMASTPTGHGYWLFASDGGVFSYGDAAFYGSTGSIALNQPVVGATPSPGGHGYRLVASDGGVFSFGDAPFFGSTGSSPPAQPVVAVTSTSTGLGYWMTVANGAVLAYGDAHTY